MPQWGGEGGAAHLSLHTLSKGSDVSTVQACGAGAWAVCCTRCLTPSTQSGSSTVFLGSLEDGGEPRG